MKLIVGLGNPGDKYKNNRHNVGFMFADYLFKRAGSSQLGVGSFKVDNKLQAEVCKINVDNEQIVVAKPQTFMNLSGVSVSKLLGYWKLDIENLIVVHDDLDILLGKYKFQKNIGPKLHNGISSIEKNLGTADFLRVRVGVNNRTSENQMSGESYVLGDFFPEEKTIVEQVFSEIYSKLITHNS